MQARGPKWGYFPELTKSLLVVALRNVKIAEELFRGMGIKVIKGSRYLRVFVGNREAEDIFLAQKVQGWTELVKTILGVAYKHTHSDYAGL